MSAERSGFWIALSVLLLVSLTAHAVSADEPTTSGSVFLPAKLVRQARKNAASNPQAAAMREEIVGAAKPWLAFSEEQLWEMMFGNTIKRSWMVWSNGFCPACKKSVPMYNWVINPFHHLWKVACPHCSELFPKNDFEKFYRSGLDEHAVFDPKRADRSLLFNADHPDPKDPLHTFGVDDGEGYVSEGNRWRFIGAYLIYGHWKQLIQGGIVRLSAAYAATGDPAYAHHAGVLLDRVADLYPSHDFGKQGVMYEGPPRSGYVSTWHDACIETRQMALAYDMVRDALAKDTALASFLESKAKRYGISTPKATPGDVLRNIDNGLLRHPQQNPDRIYCNYPQTEMTVAILKSVLNETGGREEARAILEEVIEKAASVDGVTGEKGLAGYAVFATQNIATVLATYGRSDPAFLKELIQRHPRLVEMFRFHIDVWCGQRYYPRIGDCGIFARPDPSYVAVNFSKLAGVGPSMFAFFWQLYEITRDPAFVQVLAHANEDKTDGLPYDLFAVDPVRFRQRVADVIKRVGAVPKAHSVDKKAWHLAVLKGGEGERQRALWLDYDSGGYHSHADGLNIGLFAYGLDLLPDFGYPPVQFGGWGAPRAVWYTQTAAHNTVVVDGKNQRNLAGPMTQRAGFDGKPFGKSTLWADGKTLRAVRAKAPEVYDLPRYERTVAMADVSPDTFYVFDLFHIRGGSDHARMTYSAFGSLTTDGLTLQPAPDYGHDTQLRRFRTDTAPRTGWSVDWKIEDRYKLLPPGEEVHLRLTDLTEGAEASAAEAWVSSEGYTGDDGEWIPGVMTRRRADRGPLESDFVGILQPYRKQPFLVSARRLAAPAGVVAAEVKLADGRRDLWIAAGRSETARSVTLSEGSGVTFEGDLALIRFRADGSPAEVAVSGARSLKVGGWTMEFKPDAGLIELHLENGKASLRSGEGKAVRINVRR